MDLAPLLQFRAAAPRPSVGLLADPAIHHVAPGRRVRFALRVENREARLQDVEVYVEEALDGWLGELKAHRLRLPAGGAAVLFLRVSAPADAAPGERQTFQVVAVGAHAPAAPAAVLLEAVADPPVG